MKKSGDYVAARWMVRKKNKQGYFCTRVRGGADTVSEIPDWQPVPAKLGVSAIKVRQRIYLRELVKRHKAWFMVGLCDRRN